MNLMTKEKPYNTLNAYYRQRYGKKVFKVSLDAGFTCPNKDGTVGVGGCTFCSPSGSGDFAGKSSQSLQEQFENIAKMLHKKWPDALYIPYFQANTNTYAPVEKLKTLYETALSLHQNVVGLSIATRPDAIAPLVYNLLEDIARKCDLQIELGLQTIHKQTAKAINRAHDLEIFTQAVKELRKRNISVVVHIINGLPGETKNMMIDTINYVNKLDIQGIKIHMLHVMKKTAMGHQYLQSPFPILTLNEYVDIVVTQIEHLRPDIIIHRLTGDAPKDLLIEPQWSLKKFVVMNEIDKELRRRKSFQGVNYKK
jgi:radical SAM protein (TIGR01212 family)